MPFLSGNYVIRLTTGTPVVFGGVGPWINAGFGRTTLGVQFGPATTGTAVFAVGGTNLVTLSDGVTYESVRVLELPFGFQFLNINRQGGGATGLPDNVFQGEFFFPPNPWTIPEFGWTEAINVFNAAVAHALLTSFTFNGTYAYPGGATPPLGLYNNDGSGAFEIEAGIEGTFDALGPQVTPTPPVVTTGPGAAVTVTPGPGTVIVVVSTPGNPDVVVPVTPGIPVVIPVPPGPVTITPVNYPITPGPGITVTVPLDYVLSGQLIIDLALTPVQQFIVDPSGIYTLVPGKLFDTIWEHADSPPTSQDVDIPRPFGVLNFVPEDEDM